MDKNLHNHGGLTLTNNSTKLLKQIKLANIKIYKTQSVCHFNQNVGKDLFSNRKECNKVEEIICKLFIAHQALFFWFPRNLEFFENSTEIFAQIFICVYLESLNDM